jgi:hypothetical protein
VSARTLPVIAAFRHAIASVRDHLGFAFRISLPVYALLIPVLVLASLAGSLTGSADPASGSPANAFLSTLVSVATLIAFAIIAVRWHRFILRDEVPPASSAVSMPPEVWRYAGNLIILMLMIFAGILVAALVIVALLGPQDTLTPGIVAAIVAAALLIGVIVTRLSVKFPAIALGRTDFGFRDAWRATEGNALQILGYTVLTSLVVLAATLLVVGVGAMLKPLGAGFAFAVELILQIAVNWLLTIFSCSVLTSLYGYFVEGRDF